MPLETSLERPAPVRVIANAVSGYIAKLGPIWVEGQIAQLTRRPTSVFLTLRDPLAEVSVQVICPRTVLDSMPTPVTEGAQVVVFAKFQYYVPRGSLSLSAREIRPVGLGALLARIEQRRRLLAAEGLFDPARKRRPPFLPNRIGLVVGRSSAAERDVVENATRRWPGVSFNTAYAVVQGHDATRQVIEALHKLDNDDSVDVIVIARGGGALEDLLPFSDEGLVRAVAKCRTPVVSAIGHEEDQPLLDLVADVRASTPTDAARRIVPDVADELQNLERLRGRTRYATRQLVQRELRSLNELRSRPVLAEPHRLFDHHQAGLHEAIERARHTVHHRLLRADDDLAHHLARVRSLSPLATLQRGYAVVQTGEGHPVTDAAGLAQGEEISIRFARGRATAEVQQVDATPADDATEDRR